MICKTCQKDKPESAFPRSWFTLVSGERKFIRKPTCSGCKSKAQRLRNPEQRRAINARGKAKYRESKPVIKQVLRDHIGQHECQKCGTTKSLQFHHRDPNTKAFGINWALQHSYSLEILKVEAAKCDLLCNSCHQKLHGGNKKSPRDAFGRFRGILTT